MASETTNTTEVAKSGVRNFRNIADIENFYRFVYENDLRREAKMVLQAICGEQKKAKKKSKSKSKSRKLQ